MVTGPDLDIARIASALVGTATSGVAGPGLLIPDAAHPFADLLGLTRVVERSELPLVKVYLTGRDYLPGRFAAQGISEYPPEMVRLDLLYLHPRNLMLAQLAVLNHAVADPALSDQIRAEFVRRLPVIEPYLAPALAGADGKAREFLARGPILRAIRDVLAHAEVDPAGIKAHREAVGFPPAVPMDLMVAAILLVHVTGDLMGARSDPTEPSLGGLPRSLAMELVQNSLFNRSEDVGDQLARSRLMWHSPDIAALSPPPRLPPVEMLGEATGVDYDTLIAAAYALWAYVQQDNRTNAPVLALDALCLETPELTDAAFAVLASTPDELAAQVRADTADWQMLQLQTHPVLRLPTGYLVLDEVYLLDRVTSGLFWLVHDYEKQRGGERAAKAWRGVHGGMFELLAEQRIRRLAPPLLGAGRDTYFSEEHLKELFPGQGRKHCDIGIDFGGTVVLADAVSGQISVPTRTIGDAAALDKDLERLVYKKTRQLDDTATRLLQDSPATRTLLGRPAERIQPVVIHAGQFPHSPPVSTIIDTQLKAEGLLSERDARITPLAVLSIDDLEVAELVRTRHGNSLPDLLDAWRLSDYRTTTLRNYLIETYGLRGPMPRSDASKGELDAHMEKVVSLIQRSRKPEKVT